MACKEAALLEARERSDSRQSPRPTFGASGCYPLAFSFCDSAKKKKRGISFKNAKGLKGNARNCLYSEKVECLPGNIGGFITHGMQGSCAIGGSRAKRQPTVTEADVRRQRVLPALAMPQRSDSRQSPEPTFGASGCCPPGKETLNTNKIRCYSVSC